MRATEENNRDYRFRISASESQLMGVVTEDLPRRSTRLQARNDHAIKSNRSICGPQQSHGRRIKEESDAPLERQTSLIVKSRQPKLAKLRTPSRLIGYLKTTSACRSPPIHAPRFGLIQETLGHDLYELLVAAMLWNRTRGMQAMPIFLALTTCASSSSQYTNSVLCLPERKATARTNAGSIRVVGIFDVDLMNGH